MNDSFAFIRSILNHGDISDATKVSILQVALDNIHKSPLVSPCGDDTEQYRISVNRDTQVNDNKSLKTTSILVPDLSLASVQTPSIDNWRMEQLEPWARWWKKIGLKVGPNSWELCKRIYEQYGEAAVLRARDRAVVAGGWADKVEAAILADMQPKPSKNDAIMEAMFAGPEPANLQEALKHQDALFLYQDGKELTPEQAQDLWLYSPEIKPRIIGQPSQTTVSQ